MKKWFVCTIRTLLKMTTRVIFQILITCVVCCMLWYILYVLRVEKVPGNERKKNNHDDDEENNNKNERYGLIFFYKMNNRTTIPYNQRLSEYPNKVRNMHLNNSKMIFSEYEFLLQNLTHI